MTQVPVSTRAPSGDGSAWCTLRLVDGHAERYPSLAEYLERLPLGIDSYPRHLVKSSLLRGLLAECPAGGDVTALPVTLRSVLSNPPPPSAWIPEVHFVACHFAVVDMHQLDPEEMQQRTYRANRKLTESAMYRALATVSSPGVLLRVARMSWGLIHKGITLHADVESNAAVLTLRHPPHLYTSVAHRSAALGFIAVLEASHGKNPHAEVVHSAVDHTQIRASWE